MGTPVGKSFPLCVPNHSAELELVRLAGVEPACLWGGWLWTNCVYQFPPDAHRKWRAGRDSNPQPAVLETAALPIELPTHGEIEYRRMITCTLPPRNP